MIEKKSHHSYHVSPDSKGGWTVRKGGSHRASKRFEEKKDAVDWALRVSRNQRFDFVLHRKDGTVESYSVYGERSRFQRDQDATK